MFYIDFQLRRIAQNSMTRGSITMGFGSKCGILNKQVIYIEN